MARTAPSELDELADVCGVQRQHVGADGRVHAADDDTLVAVLGALGVAAAGPAEVAESLRATRAARRARVLDPVVVHVVGRGQPTTVRLPAAVDPRRAWVAVELEGGGTRTARLEHDQLRLGGPGAAELPVGLHRLRVEAPGIDAEALLVAAPRCPAPERGWGAFLPLHALRTPKDWGVGRYGDLGALARWVRGLGGSFVGTLPLYPAAASEAAGASPYRPSTRLAWSELHVDPAPLPELAEAPEAREQLGSAELQQCLAAARRSELVDPQALRHALRSVLAPMARSLLAAPSARRRELEGFAAAHPELVAYARFCAAVERLGPRWRDWGGGPRTVPPGVIDDEAVGYHLYVHWVAHEQLHGAAREGGLYLDLPVGVDPDGFDTWWEPEIFVEGLRVGAPPDAFHAGGQDWGVPPPHPEAAAASGYRYLVDVLRHAMSPAAMLRLDHVMGLHRLYCIPPGADARHGVYVRYPAEELRAVVAVEAHRAGVVVVGEDLGTVPGEVRRAMAEDGMLRSWVLQFESAVEDPLPEPPEACLATWGTHDLAPFAAAWDGDDIEDRAAPGEAGARWAVTERARRAAWRAALEAALSLPRAGRGAGGSRLALRGVLDHLAAGPARLVMVDLEDLWGERRPHNRPGTPAAANWRRRAAKTLCEIESDPEVVETLGRVEHLRRAGALPPARPVPADANRDLGRPGRPV
ncbi:MAG TPA: 4-alpha-glucanotransferase [Acidimicrobiales bacterium]|nr:4-alpha-glucanotransferase [Acidimicrobiales bacterium]HLH45879.1 4-alpha-glucanotransferase [Acidimicrobiales bacterium]